MTLIDTSLYTLVGTMTGSGGLAAIFDGNPSTYGHREANYAWVGVDFGLTPKRIDKVEVVSAANGMDASSATAEVTLILKGRIGAQTPITLDTLVFNDVNQSYTKTLNSYNKFTEFDRVWVEIRTSVWCLVTEVRIFEQTGAFESEPYYRKVIQEPRRIYAAYTPMRDLFQVIEVTDPVRLEIRSKISIKHTNYAYGIGWGLSFGLRGPFTTYDEAMPAVEVGGPYPTWITDGGTDTENIEPKEVHYNKAVVTTDVDLSTAGFYCIEAWMNTHGSSADPNKALITSSDWMAVIMRENTTGAHNFTRYQLVPLA